MQLMLDSANLEEIRKIKEAGLLGGLTTNPLIIKRGLSEMSYEGNFLELAKKILELTGNTPAFFQVNSHNSDELVEQAERVYYTLRPYGNPHIKVPFNPALESKDDPYAGVKAIRRLNKKGIPILATAIVTPPQALLAALAGAKYSVLMLRPYDNIIAESFGMKLDEQGFLTDEEIKLIINKTGKSLPSDSYLSGLDILKRTKAIFEKNCLESKILIAGIRNPVQFSSVTELGIDAITLPYSVFSKLFFHEGTKRFVRDTFQASPEMYTSFLNYGK